MGNSSVWKGLKKFNNYKPDCLPLANELNEFYCRIEREPSMPPIPWTTTTTPATQQGHGPLCHLLSTPPSLSQ